MKIALLGATGQTGIPLIEQALAKGHSVKAIVRSPDKLDKLKNEANLEIVEGNIFSADSLAKHFEGVDVVMSTLGFSPFSKPVIGYINATKAMVEALKKTSSCNRLILMHSWYTKEDSRQNSPFFMRWLFLPLISPTLNNMQVAEDYLKNDDEAKDITWTTVLPAGLSNNPVTGDNIVAEEDCYAVPGKSSRISRANVARYMIKVAEEDLHKRKTVAIAI